MPFYLINVAMGLGGGDTANTRFPVLPLVSTAVLDLWSVLLLLRKDDVDCGCKGLMEVRRLVIEAGGNTCMDSFWWRRRSKTNKRKG